MLADQLQQPLILLRFPALPSLMTQSPEPAVAHLGISPWNSHRNIRKLSLLIIAEFHEKPILLLAPRLLYSLVALNLQIFTSEDYSFVPLLRSLQYAPLFHALHFLLTISLFQRGLQCSHGPVEHIEALLAAEKGLVVEHHLYLVSSICIITQVVVVNKHAPPLGLLQFSSISRTPTPPPPIDAAPPAWDDIFGWHSHPFKFLSLPLHFPPHLPPQNPPAYYSSPQSLTKSC